MYECILVCTININVNKHLEKFKDNNLIDSMTYNENIKHL